MVGMQGKEWAHRLICRGGTFFRVFTQTVGSYSSGFFSFRSLTAWKALVMRFSSTRPMSWGTTSILPSEVSKSVSIWALKDLSLARRPW